MTLLSTILIGAAMAVLVTLIAFLFEGGLREEPYGGSDGEGRVICHVIFGLICGAAIWAILYFCPIKIVAIIGIILCVLATIFFVGWCCREATRWYEVLLVCGILIIMWYTATVVLSVLTKLAVWTFLVPTIVLIVVLAVVWIKYFICHYLGHHLPEPVRHIAYLIAAIVTAVVAIILIICLLTGLITIAGFGKGRGQGQSSEEVISTDETTDVVNGPWFHFYNSDLQSDEDVSNNYNFGPDPYYECWTADPVDYDRNFRERLKLDPALTAADTAWLDAVVGTRYLGEFYESCKHDWAKTMNVAKERFMKDQIAYYRNLDAFFDFLDSAVKVEVRECKAVHDQMYMNPYTVNGVPDIIVMLTNDHFGYELVYTFVIKDNVFEVAYRINCGYQPTDVAEIMHIIPIQPEEPTPEPTTPEPTTEPTTPEPTTEPTKPTEPTTEPTKPTEPTTTYNKDPEKASYEYLEPNDDPGPGPDTNNGVGSTESSKDQPENSNHYESYDDYRNEIEEMESINETQKQGGDSNTPSTSKPSSNTNVDNNGDTGTGNGSIDVPTPTQKPATAADTGEEINTAPAGEWGAPPD